LLAVNSYIIGLAWRDLLSLGIEAGKDLALTAMDKDETGVPLMPDSAVMILPSYDLSHTHPCGSSSPFDRGELNHPVELLPDQGSSTGCFFLYIFVLSFAPLTRLS
jgi:hypothetical protein